MKLKQIFCRHKKLTAVGIYQKSIEKYYKWSLVDTRIVCKCNRCGKECEFSGQELQTLRNQHIKVINIDNVIDNKLWGKWW